MNTPIYDFVKEYAERKSVRLHMPGHKGKGPMGFEKYDITEFFGADSLFHPDGIIACDEAACGELKVDTYRYFKEIYKDEK